MASNRPTLITTILDRSGSMTNIRADMIGGFNEFIKAQRKTPGKTRWTMYQFDGQDPHELVYSGKKGRNVPKLGSTDAPFDPRGRTPLHDAIGYVLPRVKPKKGQLSVVVIITDGYENASKEFTNKDIKKLIKKREDKGWQFVFLGADQDAYATAVDLGIMAGSTYTFASTGASTRAVADSMTTAVSSYRETGAQQVSHTVVDESGDVSPS